jgi:hypothetical protein
MLKPRTLKCLALMLVGFGLLLLLAGIFPDSPAGIVLVGPILSVYVLHKLGVPGLLEHDGFCGWGWCSPTLLGWLVAAALWLAVAWLLAWCIQSLIDHDPKR